MIVRRIKTREIHIQSLMLVARGRVISVTYLSVTGPAINDKNTSGGATKQTPTYVHRSPPRSSAYTTPHHSLRLPYAI